MPFSSIVAQDIDELVADLSTVLPRFAGKTVLITGAGGFLMSYIVDVLARWSEGRARDGVRILALDNFKTGLPERLAHLSGAPSFRLITHDIAQPVELDEPVHFIVHGASIASPTVYRQFPLETIDANVGGTRFLLDFARRHAVEGMLVMSTSEIYGDPDPASGATTSASCRTS